LVNETLRRVAFLKRAIDETPSADTSLARRVRVVEQRLIDVREALTGDPTLARRQEATTPSLEGRLGTAISNSWGTSLAALNPSQTGQIELVRREFGAVLARVTQLVDVELKSLEDAAEHSGVPWTSGRVPKPPF
jgi:hypothetical protein